MLDSIRKKKDNFIYSFIILATAAVMLLYGTNKMANDNANDGAAAWVNGDVITKGEFRQELSMAMEQYQSMLGGQYDEKFLAALQIPQRTLEQLVQYKLLSQQAKRMNIIVPDGELANYIRTAPYFQKDGKFDADMYAKIPNRGVQERRMRERLGVQKLQSYLTDRVKLTPAALKGAYELRDTKVDLLVGKVDFNELAKGHQPSAKEIDDYVKATPEKDLQGYYEQRKREYTDKAQVQLKQIKVGVPYQATEPQKQAAKKKIEEIAKEVKPENFAAVAKAKSEDEYAKKGGEVGWVARGTLEGQLEAALDKLDVGKVSSPIETSFGYFILMPTAKKDAVVHPLSEVKAKIATAQLNEKHKTQFADEKRKEWDKMLADGKSIEAELKKNKVELKKTGPFSIGQGSIPNVGAADSIVDAVFALTPANPTPKALLQYQTAFYYVKLVSVEPPKAADLTKNEEMLEKSVGTTLQTELVTQWVNKLQKAAAVKTEMNFGPEGAGSRDTEVD